MDPRAIKGNSLSKINFLFQNLLLSEIVGLLCGLPELCLFSGMLLVVALFRIDVSVLRIDAIFKGHYVQEEDRIQPFITSLILLYFHFILLFIRLYLTPNNSVIIMSRLSIG